MADGRAPAAGQEDLPGRSARPRSLLPPSRTRKTWPEPAGRADALAHPNFGAMLAGQRKKLSERAFGSARHLEPRELGWPREVAERFVELFHHPGQPCRRVRVLGPTRTTSSTTPTPRLGATRRWLSSATR